MDATVQKEKCGVGNNEETVRDIDLQKKKKNHNFREILFPLSTWPLLSRDVISAFCEVQSSYGHRGSFSSTAEELREIINQLASDIIPEPQITMKYEMLRLCTMKTFPGLDRPFAIRIIGAGFYYAGHQDQVICYCCGNRKDKWVLEDIPLLIHQNMAPSCSFLTHNALVNIPIRKANSTESPSTAEIRLLPIQRSDGSNQSDTAHDESALMILSSEQKLVKISNILHQIKRGSPQNQLTASGIQSVLDHLQRVSVNADSMEDLSSSHQQYAVRNVRMNSFQCCPADLRQKPEQMAECGFYYTGSGDCVRCFVCGVEVRHWTSEDDPWIVHTRWSASCIYVLKMKGEEFVSLVKMAVEIVERDEAARKSGGGNQAPQNSNKAAHAVTATEASNNRGTTNFAASNDLPGKVGATDSNIVSVSKSTPSPDNAEIQKYLLTDAAQSVLDMGYQPKLVLRAIEKVLMKKGTEELTGQIILEAAFEIEEVDKSQSQNQPPLFQSTEGVESTEKGHEASGNIQSEESQIDSEKIMREHRELQEATLCKICLENTISIVFLPCGHLVTCTDCAPALKKCPICRTLIKQIFKKTSNSSGI